MATHPPDGTEPTPETPVQPETPPVTEKPPAAEKPPETPAPVATAASTSDGPREIRIYSYDKVLYLWPTVAVAFLAYLVQVIAPNPVGTEGFNIENFIGVVFILVLIVNLTVLCFDFTRMMFILYSISILALILLLSLINMALTADVWSFLGALKWDDIRCSDNFYLYIFIIGGFMLLAGYIKARVAYWIIDDDKLHCTKGFLGTRTSYKTLGLNVDLIIPDVLEWAIGFGAGSLKFEEPLSREFILLRNIPKAKQVYDRIRTLQREMKGIRR